MAVFAQNKGINQVLQAFAARIAAALTRAAFRVMRLFPQQEKIAFMSRQSKRPLDFQLLEPALRERFSGHRIVWVCVPASCNLGFAAFARQLWHAATAQLCIVDGYVPAVSVCEGLHRAVCMQLWHALGAVKKFGCQSLGTSAGHDGEIARILRMHKGYDAVVAGLPGAAGSFACAFGCEADKVIPLGLPRVDYLRERRAATEEGRLGVLDLPPVLEHLCERRNRGSFAVLYAPTFRKGAAGGAFRLSDAVRGLRTALPVGADLVVARHPLQSSEGRAERCGSCGFLGYLDGIPAIDALCCVDAVITDYSAIAFEAWLAGKKVFFYVPDIDAYRVSPGLNIDPLAEFSDVAFKHVADVTAAVAAHAKRCSSGEEGADDPSAFDCFMRTYAEGLEPGCAQRIADCAMRLVRRKNLTIPCGLPSRVDKEEERHASANA